MAQHSLIAVAAFSGILGALTFLRLLLALKFKFPIFFLQLS
jgi:hypothetical protein